MIYVLVFLMAQGPGEEFREYYNLQKEFGSKEECVAFVSNEYTNAIIKDHILEVYPLRPVENVWCMKKETWEALTGKTI